MTIDEENKLKRDVAKLQKQMEQLANAATIPFLVEGAFKGRLKIAELARVIFSTKGATTENQAVSEAGLGSYNVLKPPDAFLQVTVSGTVYYIPVYT